MNNPLAAANLVRVHNTRAHAKAYLESKGFVYKWNAARKCNLWHKGDIRGNVCDLDGCFDNSAVAIDFEFAAQP